MSDEVEVNPDKVDYAGRPMYGTYEIAWDFPGGLRCCVCFRVIPDGTPYGGRAEAMTEDSVPVEAVACVYCANS
jgi:hypothetical protein